MWQRVPAVDSEDDKIDQNAVQDETDGGISRPEDSEEENNGMADGGKTLENALNEAPFVNSHRAGSQWRRIGGEERGRVARKKVSP